MYALQTVTVRPAEAGDRAALRELLLDLHEHHARLLPERLTTMRDPAMPFCEELEARLGRLAGGGGANLIVAELDGELVGCAEVYLRQSDPGAPVVPRVYGYLQSLMVAEPARDAGVGSALLSAAEGWARRRGASELLVDAWDCPGGPAPFYEGQGYSTLRRTLARRLD